VGEFEGYLNRLRAGLHLSASRADELVAEAESHLEARAAQWERMGRSRREAAEAAMQGFGEPEAIAQQLTRANQRHRLAGAFRSVLAFLLASAALLISLGLLDDAPPWLGPMLRWLRTVPVDLQPAAFMVVTAALAAPGGVLAGVIAGSRRWWLAALPGGLLGLLCLVTAQWWTAAAALGAGVPIIALCGFAGSRASGRPAAAAVLTALCVALLSAFGLSELLMIGDAVGVLAAVAVLELATGLLGLVAMWASRRAQRETLVWGGVGCTGAVVAMLWAGWRPFGAFGPEGTWVAIITAQAVFGGIIAWHYHTSRRPMSERHREPEPRSVGRRS
jgi:hypothetical protein